MRPVSLSGSTLTPGYGPRRTPTGGLPLVWVAVALCLLLALTCVWLVNEVGNSQEKLSATAKWWKDVRDLRARLQHLEESLFDDFPEPPLGQQLTPQLMIDLQDPPLANKAPVPYAEHSALFDRWREKSRFLAKVIKGYLRLDRDVRDGVVIASTELRKVLNLAAEVGSSAVVRQSHELATVRTRLNLISGLSLLTAFMLAIAILRVRSHRAALEASANALRKSEERYREMFSQVNVAQLLVDPASFTIVDANPAACRFYGKQLDELRDRSVRNLWDHESESSAELPSPNTASTTVARHRVANGQVRDVEMHSAPVRLDHRTLLYSIIRDVTERHQAEMAMRESEKRFRTLAENVPGATYLQLSDAKGTFVYLSDHIRAITGWPAEAFLEGMTQFAELYYPGQAQIIADQRGMAVRDRRPFFVMYRLKHADGGFRWVEEHGQGVYSETGELKYLQGTIFDVTGRRRAKEALAAEKERLSVTLRSIADGVVSTDTQGVVELMNEAAEEMLGCTQEEAIGRPLAAHYAVQDEETGDAAPPPLERWLDPNAQAPFTQSVVMRRQDNLDRTLAVSGSPLRTLEGEIMGAVVVLRDITEERALEDEMQRAAKLESVGVLAGGIAHDFNNILAGVIGNLSLARMDMDSESEAAYSLKQAQDAAVRAQNLTRQLLTFAKGGAPLRKLVSLKKTIEETASFALRGSNVRCDPDVAENLAMVEVDEGQINQVLHNLVLNAAQAMPEGGVLEVEASNVALEADERLGLTAGDYICIRLSDEGLGIPEEVQQRIFDPYFTTKENGTGLGLATSYSIIKKHDGAIAMESTVDVGTTFRIYLPVAAAAIASESAAPIDAPAEAEVAKGYILLMDDELTVRDVCGRMLRSLGHQVAFAIDGEQALELYAHALAKKHPFDLVIMDLTVPGAMGGKEATRRLIELDSDVRVVVSSGYSNDPIMAEPAKHGFCGVLRKPYTKEDLVEMIRTHLHVRRAINPLTVSKS